jgi:hypothetical protein
MPIPRITCRWEKRLTWGLAFTSIQFWIRLTEDYAPPANRLPELVPGNVLDRIRMRKTMNCPHRLGTAVVLALFVTWGCTPTEPSAKAGPIAQTSLAYEERIGVAELELDMSEGCLAVRNPSIKPGVKVTFVDQGDAMQLNKAPGIIEGSVVDRLSQECGKDIATGNSGGSGFAFYRIRTVKEWQGNRFVFAIVDPSGPIALRNRKVEVDLDGDGTTESFRVCSSAEGVHYQVWSGEPLQGKPRWHWYVYAGYDTEPSCTEKDYFGPREP